MFDYDLFVLGLEEKEHKLRESPPAIDNTDLFSQNTSVYQKLYPEYQDLLAKPHHRAYYHKEAASALGHLGQFSTIIVRLPPFNNIAELIDYFGCNPHVLAECVIHGRFIPLISSPRLYLDNQVRAVYEPIFRRIHQAGSERVPVYESRLEDALVRKRHRQENWDKFVAEKTERIRNRIHVDKIKVGRLTYTDAARYFGERIAYPELFGISHVAHTITDMMLWNIEKAAMVAYTCDFLITGPITKDRKAHPICVWNFDLNYFKDTSDVLLQYRVFNSRSHSFRLLASSIARLFKGIRVSRRDIKQEPMSPVFITHTDNASHELLDVYEEEKLASHVDHCSDLQQDFIDSIVQSYSDFKRYEESYLKYRQEFKEICRGLILPEKNLSLRFIKTIVGPALGLSTKLVEPLSPALSNALLDLLPQAEPVIQHLADVFLPMEWDNLQQALYPVVGFDYVPTFHFWNVPALPIASA